MALDPIALTAALSDRLRTIFTDAKAQEWASDKAADELAKAIADCVHGYVKAGRATGVVSEVRNAANAVIGTAQQTGGGTIA
ncbi:hypothetical protein DBR17_02005 [Sphingomonas sp. HMWF008]|nr:hypothetical protein DBR17_02005 [Sphingomonas sp. HMWF008]